MPIKADKMFVFVETLTKECGKLIKERIWAPKMVEEKSSEIDVVTETDKEIEKKLITSLSLEYPEHKFIGEETVAAGVKPELTSAPTWIIDPIDGTLNFVHGYPIVVISIALLVEKTAEIGIIYNPIFDQMFTARRGKGAFLNGRKINASKTEELRKSIVQLEYGPGRDKNETKIIEENVNALKSRVQAIRGTGSSAWNMAMVGLGGSDAYVEFGLHIWDMAAGDLIVREAGGTVIDPSGGPLDLMSCRVLCSSTKKLASELVSVLKQHYVPRDG